MPTLLVVDDEPNLLFSFQECLASETLHVLTARTAREGVALVERQRPDAMILDVRLPDRSGLEAFNDVRQIDPRLPVIIITAHPATEIAIEAMKRGAFDYLVKPCDFRQLRELVDKAIRQSRLTHVRAIYGEETEDGTEVDRIVGQSAAMQEVYKAIGRVAAQDITVLIQGESGTGKELVARALYQHSRRVHGPFLAINCAALPEALLESELFGHERGAFTGADRRRIGKFEQADGGTIFLDEVADLSPATQAKMLRLLQDHRFERLGGNETLRADVRIIAATNRPLDDLVAGGRFRDDLYYRLRVFTIQLPPLRQRREDLRLLVEHFLKRFNQTLGRRVVEVESTAMRRLEEYDWPGNIRELQAAIKYGLLHCHGEVLSEECLPRFLRPAAVEPEANGATLDVVALARNLLRLGETDIYEKVSAAVDRVLLREVLEHVGGNQAQASEVLGISRNTLRARLRAANLLVEKQVLSGIDQRAQ